MHLQITKCSPADFLDDRRVVIVVTYDGLIESVEPPKGSNSSPAIFGFPAAQLKVSVQSLMSSACSQYSA
jgi:hypothetical protein